MLLPNSSLTSQTKDSIAWPDQDLLCFEIILLLFRHDVVFVLVIRHVRDNLLLDSLILARIGEGFDDRVGIGRN